jgi:hypothetical protein
MLLQSRANRVSDVLTLKDTDEIAESAPGAVQDAVTRKIREEIKEIEASHEAAAKPPIASQEAGEKPKVHYVTIRNGKAEFDKS